MSLGVTRQVDDFLAWLRARAGRVGEVFTDNDVSATSADLDRSTSG